MFGYNDKIAITGVNVIDKNGKLLSNVIKFPLDSDYKLPNNIRQISIFERYSDDPQDISKSFNIYVGKTCTLLSFFAEYSNSIEIEDLPTKDFNIGSQLLCYNTNDNGVNVIFAIINSGDIVVNNNEELGFVLETISREFMRIKKSIHKIKNLSKGIK